MMAPDVNVVTVVDPDQEVVELRPQEILQVVYVDGKDVKWYDEALDRISLKVLRKELFITDEFERPNRGNFEVIPYVKTHGVKQHHFWFRIDPRALDEIKKPGFIARKIAILHFQDKNNQSIGTVTVKLVADEEDKKAASDLLQNAIWTGQDKLLIEAQWVGLAGRIVNPEKGYILNPSNMEQVAFEVNQHEMLVEIAEPPTVLSKSKWRALGQYENLNVVELASRSIGNTNIQRFLIKNKLYSLPYGVEQMRLGIVHFRSSERVSRNDKQINFWITRCREIGQEFNEQDEFGYGCDEEIDVDISFSQPVRRGISKTKIEIQDIGTDLLEGVKTKKTYWQKMQKEVVDPTDNTLVDMPLDKELVVHMYRDMSFKAPYYRVMDWECHMEYHSGIELRAIESDNHRQRFVFTKKDGEFIKNRIECLKFKCHEKIRRLHVRM